ncbi:MAG: cbb3-type cytochrome c oxidase subunit I, partial [Elusimicrobia bacterium]|nr:cbb3-type cytochrome c oxidase subunit I [Elusimicrobiota bacterium]
LPLGLPATDIHLHDTYYVIGHFHYVVAPGTLMALFGGIYFWFPKMFGRKMDDRLGRLHFWTSAAFLNGVFACMLIYGVAGVQRRLYDPTGYAHALRVQPLNVVMTVSAFCLALAQIPFIYNFFNSLWRGEKASQNPWDATTLEWAAPSPPPHGNFDKTPVVYRGPYEYSVPGAASDFLPQHLPDGSEPTHPPRPRSVEVPA